MFNYVPGLIGLSVSPLFNIMDLVGLFFVGWLIQFIGHYFEGRKPAFVDDLIGLLIGPLFIAAEAGFLLGMRTDVEDAVIAKAGPTR